MHAKKLVLGRRSVRHSIVKQIIRRVVAEQSKPKEVQTQPKRSKFKAFVTATLPPVIATGLGALVSIL